MIVLGIESSCDETGVAVVGLDGDAGPQLLGDALHSQVSMHEAYGGVVPELASRDHIRRIVPLTRHALIQAGLPLTAVDLIAYTRGPGLAGALLVGSAFAVALSTALQRPAMAVHHLEGHLMSPFLSATPPRFPFVALLVSGGHTQLMRVEAVGRYALLGETIDDASGEAFDKTAKLLGLGYPGGPALARLAETGRPDAFRLPRPLLHSGGLNFSFAGLKTAVMTAYRRLGPLVPEQAIADLAAATQQAIVDLLVAKTVAALRSTGLDRLVVAGGVGANSLLRQQLGEACRACAATVHYPELRLCTDNGAMIAAAAAMRIRAGLHGPSISEGSFGVSPRWPLEAIS